VLACFASVAGHASASHEVSGAGGRPSRHWPSRRQQRLPAAANSASAGLVYCQGSAAYAAFCPHPPLQAGGAGAPLRTDSFSAVVGDGQASFLLTAYADRLLVVVSQLGTLGTVLAAQKEAVLGGSATYRVDTLLGRPEQPLAELCARQLAERLADAGCGLPLLLCLALERSALTLQAVQQVVKLVLQHPVWP